MFRTILASGATVLALTASMPLAAQDAKTSGALTAPEISYEEWTLANGLRVIALPDASTSTVTTSMWYDVGSKHDPEGRSGFAHLFEHILSRKTENMPYNMINRLTEDVGGQRNASTGDDRTNYYETVPAEYLETMLWTHAERMARPVVDEEVFEKERSIVKEELRQRILAPPYGRLRMVFTENGYDILPNRRPGIGNIDELDAATLDDARAFHQAYYGPDTATMIVAGNFETAKLRAMIDQYFAAIPRRSNAIPLEITAREATRTQPRSVVATAPNVPLPVVGYMWQLPGQADPDIAALSVLDAIMSNGQNSRLYQALVRTGKAVQAQQGVNTNEDGGFFVSFAILNADADMDEVSGLLAAEIEKIRTTPVTAAELSEAKNEWVSATLRRRETAQGRAFELGEALVSTGDPKSADRLLANISKVTAADVMRVAKKWLDPRGQVALRYVAGEANPASYANPVPMPTFRTVPAATGEPAELNAETVRQAPPAPGTIPAVSRAPLIQSELDNGITLVSTQTSDVPLATITVVLPGGTSADPRGKAGLASLVAGLADQGTATRSAQQIAQTLESLGASLSAQAGSDGAFVSLTAPVGNLDAAGAVLSDVVRNAVYPQADLDRERKRAIDGLQVSMKDPGGLASMIAAPVMFGTAPYGGVATTESLTAITRDDLARFRQTWWHPAAAQIVISGGISADRAKSVANALFGNWKSDQPAPTRVADPSGPAPAPRTLVIDMPEAGQAMVLAGVRAVSRSSDDYYPLLLANTVLGSGSNGRLFEEVRTKRGLSYGSYSSFAGSAGDAVLTASAQTKNETADEVAQVILDQFAALAAAPMVNDDLQKRRLFLGGSYARALETSAGFNGITAGLLQQGLSPDEASRLEERLLAVSPEMTLDVAARIVRPEAATLIVVGNAAEFIDDLRKLRPDLEVIAAADLDLNSETLKKLAD
ncbi:insulinase family protein [Altererythrobacter confluentis]|uniref:Insulinase family protein n=1 Tax=Allopontixanthobacter confluentis TaxID=1849021 RepID=A0A6L7GCP9_9SPHN|nr:pitrilysin family protein [Allopontixanthobacter confluentis]MXP13246.1 insulinase family protein [Allopontixanthobacter confluentis]